MPKSPIKKVQALCSEEHKLIYVIVPKAACGTLKDAFADLSGVKRGSEQWLKWRKGEVLKLDLLDPKYNQYFKFAFVRNPFARIVSAFYGIVLSENLGYEVQYQETLGSRVEKISDKIAPIRRSCGKTKGEKLTFEDFVYYLQDAVDEEMNVHWRPQYTFITKQTAKGRELLVNFIGRIRTIEQDWGLICSMIGKTIKLGHDNRSEHPPWRQVYSKTTWDIIEQRYQEDIRLFDYQQEAAAGPEVSLNTEILLSMFTGH